METYKRDTLRFVRHRRPWTMMWVCKRPMSIDTKRDLYYSKEPYKIDTQTRRAPQETMDHDVCV